MRIHLGDLPLTPSDSLESDGWTRISGLRSRAASYLPWLLGIFLLLALITPIVLVSFSVGYISNPSAANQGPPLLAAILSALLSIPAHELVHAAFLPDFGLSQSTVLAVWPRKLRFGVFYEGRMSKTRWLVMRSAPFVILALLPALWLLLTTGAPRNFTIETCMSLLILVNSLGAGADLLAAQWVLFHIPQGSILMFAGGRAYWKVNH